jgi:hypothetical protein
MNPKLGIKGNDLKLIKVTYENPTVDNILNDESKTESIPSKIRQREDACFCHFYSTQFWIF